MAELVVKGSWGSVEWATDARGGFPARDFYRGLGDSDRAKVMALFKRMADEGFIHNREHFKKVQDGLHEFKRFQIRLLGDYRPGKRFVIAHGIRKKRDELPPADVRIAVRILQEHDQREGRR